MDPAPRVFEELPIDAEHGVPVPFACGTEEPSIRFLDARRVTQCALSRICGVCGAGLGRPIAFLGSPHERARNAFHFPPTHEECARRLVPRLRSLDVPALGHDEVVVDWVVVTTAGFEYVRPVRGDEDPRARFEPNSLLSASG